MSKLLIVDDDFAIRLLYTEELLEEGYDVVAHDGAHELMDVIRKESPDLVLLDIKLGKDSGLDLLQEIRGAYDGLPVVLCSAYHEHTFNLNGLAPNCYYALKSSDMSDLKLKVKTAFEGMRKFDSLGPHSHRG